MLGASLIGTSLLLILFSYTATADNGTKTLDLVLRDWIIQNIEFGKDKEAQETIFIRQRPIRAYIKSDDVGVNLDARNAVANFADAFGLEHSFTTSDINMIIATASDISDHGKPKKSILIGLGFPESAANKIAEESDWSSGCGTYDSRNIDGRLSVSIVVGDTSLPPKKLRSCIVTGIIFGFGMRVKGQEILDYSNDYMQFLLLARSIAHCEKTTGSQNPGQSKPKPHDYLECVFDSLRSKLTE